MELVYGVHECFNGFLLVAAKLVEHVPDDLLFFSSIVRNLEPGSYLIVTVPAAQRLWSSHDEAFGHYRRYDRERFGQVWKGLPVSVKMISYYNSRLYPAAKISRMLSRLRGAASENGGRFEMAVPPAPMNRLLEKIFAGEAAALRRLLAGTHPEANSDWQVGMYLRPPHQLSCTRTDLLARRHLADGRA